MINKLRPEDGFGHLTATEVNMLQRVSAGMSNKEVVNKLSLAESPVKNRLSVLFGKIGVLDRTQAAIYAIPHGIARTAVRFPVGTRPRCVEPILCLMEVHDTALGRNQTRHLQQLWIGAEGLTRRRTSGLRAP
jgi:DNA-binding CsgD family transcriptional regulator